MRDSEIALSVISTRCSTFLKAMNTVIRNFEKNNKGDSTDIRAIRKIRKYLIFETGRKNNTERNASIRLMSGVTARLMLKNILRRHYSYFGWRYWSELPKQLNELRYRVEFSDEALRNGDFETLKPNIEYNKKLIQDNERLKEKNEHLESKLGATSQELLVAWEKQSTLEEQLKQLELEKAQSAHNHIEQLKAIHRCKQEIIFWKSAYSDLRMAVSLQSPGMKLPSTSKVISITGERDQIEFKSESGKHSPDLFQVGIYRSLEDSSHDGVVKNQSALDAPGSILEVGRSNV